MLYRSVFVETDGSQATAVLEASDVQELHEALHQDGRLLLRATPERQGQVGSKRRFPPRKLLLFAQGMEASLSAGVPVLQALEAIRDQEQDPRCALVLDEIIEDVTRGETLAMALSRHPRTFSTMFCALVEAGESSGSMPRSFERLGSFLEWRAELRATIKQAVIYPTIVLAAAYGLVMFLLGFVIPGLSEVIAKLGADELPAASRVLIATSNLIANNVPSVILGTFGGIALIVLLLRTDAGRTTMTGLLVRLPVVRSVVETLNLAALCRTMSVLLESGLTVIDAMRLSAPTLGLGRLRLALDSSRDDILSGAKVTEAFESSKLLPPVALSMITVGEKAGDLPRSFERLGLLYDRESKAAVKRALGMLEPIVTVALGVIIGGVAAVIISTLYTSIGGLAR